ncbi:MAG: hypothetical protein ACLRMJ_01040 [Alistipes finegoldii]
MDADHHGQRIRHLPTAGGRGETTVTVTASDGNPGRSRVKLGTVALTLNAGGAQCSVTVSQSPATATQTMLLYMPGRDLLKFYKQNIDGVLKAVDANVPATAAYWSAISPTRTRRPKCTRRISTPKSRRPHSRC